MNFKKHFKSFALVSPLALAIPLAFAQVNTAPLSKDQIKAEYKAEKSACDAFSGNDKDVCKQKAKAFKSVATAELKYSKDPSDKTSYDVYVARADAEYDVSKEMCDAKKGNDKDVCVKEAKANHTTDLAAAKFVKKTDKAAHSAANDINKANYKVAVQKCDALSGAQKDACVDKAKADFPHSFF